MSKRFQLLTASTLSIEGFGFSVFPTKSDNREQVVKLTNELRARSSISVKRSCGAKISESLHYFR